MQPDTLRTVTRSLATRGDRPAVVALSRSGRRTWSFAELDDHVRRLAAGLLRAGVGSGEPIGLFAPNRPEWIIAALAILEAGAVVVPMDAQTRGEQLAHLVRDSEIRRVFTARDHVRHLDGLSLQPPLRVSLLDTDDDDDGSWRRLLAGAAHAPRPIGPEDGAALFYTAGTTGPPKGVPLTHRNCASSLLALLDAGVVGPDDRVLLPLPFHHVYPFMVGLMTVLASGSALVLPASLTGPQIVRALREGEVSTIVGVPRFYEALLSGLQARVAGRGRIVRALLGAGLAASIGARRRLGVRLGRVVFRPVLRRLAPHLRLVTSGGARLNPAVAWTLEGLGWDVCTGYGLTETAPILTFNVPGQSRLETAGRPVRGVQLKLADPDHDGEGEVLAKGPNVFAGYRNLPDKSAEVFTADGWFRTGDLGRFDRDGYLTIVGRASEILVLADGKNLPPEAIEKQYAAHAAIREIGLLVRDGRLAAAIVPEPGEARRRALPIDDLVREAVTAQSRTLTAWQRVGDYVVTREPLPRTQLGKLQRHRLPERYERARRGDGEPAAAGRPAQIEELAAEDRLLLEHPAARAVWQWLTARYRNRRLTPDTSPQLDLGVDSLGWLDLTLEIRQRAGVELAEDRIASIETVRDLLQAAVEAAQAGGPGPDAGPLERPEAFLAPEQRRWLEPPGRLVRAVGVGIHTLNRALLRRLLGVRAVGIENLPADVNVVLAPNHRSYLDPLALAAVLPRARLEATFWGGWTPLLFGNPLARLFSRAARIVPVDPERAAISSLAFGAAVLQRNLNLVWFPEGGRSPTGELQRFLPGIGVLLERFRVPVVPVFIHGTERMLPPGRALPRPARITVVLGPACDPADLATRGRGQEPADRIAQALHETVADLGRREPRGARRAA